MSTDPSWPAGRPVGDGAADDTQAIQAALDAAGIVQGTVALPPGRFRCGTLRIPPHTGLSGQATPSWKQGGGTVLVLGDPTARCLIDISRSPGATLTGLCLDGGGLGSGICGVLADHDSYSRAEDNPLIERCHVADFSGDGIRLERIWCWRVRGSMCFRNRGHGLRVRGWDGFLLDTWLSMNHGAGLATHGEANAMTITGNRIEWNRGGGLDLCGASHTNVTGNYIDRSGGPAIRWEVAPGTVADPRRIVGRTGISTISGNIFYRSAKHEWTEAGSDRDCHLLLRGLRGVTVTGNSAVVGLDDENPDSLGSDGARVFSPGTALILADLVNCVITGNALDDAATTALISDRGGHRGLVLKDNPGSLYHHD
jgi:hypothetical protein